MSASCVTSSGSLPLTIFDCQNGRTGKETRSKLRNKQISRQTEDTASAFRSSHLLLSPIPLLPKKQWSNDSRGGKRQWITWLVLFQIVLWLYNVPPPSSAQERHVRKENQDLPLFVRDRDTARVREALQNGADPNCINGILIPMAIRNATDPEILELLLKYGGSPNRKDMDGWSPLTWAVTENDAAKVFLLLEAKADPNGFARGWLTPYHAAIIQNDPVITRMLETYGATMTPNMCMEFTTMFPILIREILSIRSPMIKIMERDIVFEEEYFSDSFIFDPGISPFSNWHSSEEMRSRRLSGTILLTGRLIENARSIPDSPFRGDCDSLQQALKECLDSCDTAMVREFLSNGISFNATPSVTLHREFFLINNQENENAIFTAFEEFLDFLDEQGISPDVSGGCWERSQVSLLSQIVAMEGLDLGLGRFANLLIRWGVNPNSPDSNGNTPLHHAAHSLNLDCMRILLEAGAHPNPLNHIGQTPLDIVLGQRLDSRRQEKAIRILEERGGHSSWHILGYSLTSATFVAFVSALFGLGALAAAFCGRPRISWSLLAICLPIFGLSLEMNCPIYSALLPRCISRRSIWEVVMPLSMISAALGFRKDNPLRFVGCLIAVIQLLVMAMLVIYAGWVLSQFPDHKLF